MTGWRTITLYEPVATLVTPLDLLRCCWAILPRRHWVVGEGYCYESKEPRQCSRKVREVIDGRGYCHPHGKAVRASGVKPGQSAT